MTALVLASLVIGVINIALLAILLCLTLAKRCREVERDRQIRFCYEQGGITNDALHVWAKGEGLWPPDVQAELLRVFELQDRLRRSTDRPKPVSA